METHLERYEDRELAYLLAVKEGADVKKLAAAAASAMEAAREWTRIAYQAFFEERERRGGEVREVIEKEIEAEKAEMLADLWGDIAAVHRGDAPSAARVTR
jgi:hypothetical protein